MIKRFKVKPKPRKPGTMNRTEQAYADILETKKKAGEIRDYKFEQVTFKLADDTRYTPDFYVVYPEHAEFHEVKGGLVRDDAKVKFKVAVSMFPEYGWKWCQLRNKKEGWEIKEY